MSMNQVKIISYRTTDTESTMAEQYVNNAAEVNSKKLECKQHLRIFIENFGKR